VIRSLAKRAIRYTLDADHWRRRAEAAENAYAEALRQVVTVCAERDALAREVTDRTRHRAQAENGHKLAVAAADDLQSRLDACMADRMRVEDEAREAARLRRDRDHQRALAITRYDMIAEVEQRAAACEAANGSCMAGQGGQLGRQRARGWMAWSSVHRMARRRMPRR
jgi:cysteinyl-tRNA synthetase